MLSVKQVGACARFPGKNYFQYSPHHPPTSTSFCVQAETHALGAVVSPDTPLQTVYDHLMVTMCLCIEKSRIGMIKEDFCSENVGIQYIQTKADGVSHDTIQRGCAKPDPSIEWDEVVVVFMCKGPNSAPRCGVRLIPALTYASLRLVVPFCKETLEFECSNGKHVTVPKILALTRCAAVRPLFEDTFKSSDRVRLLTDCDQAAVKKAFQLICEPDLEKPAEPKVLVVLDRLVFEHMSEIWHHAAAFTTKETCAELLDLAETLHAEQRVIDKLATCVAFWTEKK